MTQTELVMIAGMTLVTFLARYPVLSVVGRYRLPKPLLQLIRLVPPAVLTAMVVPAVLYPNRETAWLSLANPYLVAGLAAAITAWIRRDLLWTLGVGMGVFWVWRWVLMQFA